MSSGSRERRHAVVERVGLRPASARTSRRIPRRSRSAASPVAVSRSRMTAVSPGADQAHVVRRRLGPGAHRIHGVLPAVDDEGVDAVLHVRRRVGLAEQARGVGLVLGEQHPLRGRAVQPVRLQRPVRRLQHRPRRAGVIERDQRLLLVAVPRPVVLEPERRQQVQRRRLGPAVGGADADQDVVRRGLRVLDEDVEVAVVVENAGVQQLVLGVAPACAGGSRRPARRTGNARCGYLYRHFM